MNTDRVPDGAAVPDLAAVEAEVRAAIDARTHGTLRLLGHGDISIVLGWPSAAPQHALKRVPPFADRGAAQTYVATCERFFGILRDREVPVWPTTLHLLERTDGRVVVFHHQPVADSAQLGLNVLRASSPSPDHPLLGAIVRHVCAVVEPGRVGFDGQTANWVWDGGQAFQLDFSSPFLLDDTGKDLAFDTSSFLREYPTVLRPVLKRELLKVILRFTRPEGVLGDMVANLHKDGMDDWLDPVIEAAGRAGVRVDKATALQFYEDDKKLLPLTLKLKRAQRWWLCRTGRTYDSLLPERTTYGH